MIVGPDTDVRVQTVSEEGVRATLAGMPLAPWTDILLGFANQYGIDRNWAISYLLWENGYGEANTFSMAHNNPWDILCYPYDVSRCGQYLPENWGASTCRNPGNDYCYAVYPSMPLGIEAGFRLWRSYVERGWNTWFTSLSVALCGNPAGCEERWVQNVIATGNENAQRWPIVSPPVPSPIVASVAPIVLGVGLLYASLITLHRARGGKL